MVRSVNTKLCGQVRMTNPKRRLNIQQCRINAGFETANAFADVAGLNRGTYTAYEQEKTLPSVKALITMARTMRCTLEDLLNERDLLAYADVQNDNRAQNDLPSCLSETNSEGREAISSLLQILNSDREEMSSTDVVSLIAIINSSLAQKQGDGRDSAIRAAAI